MHLFSWVPSGYHRVMSVHYYWTSDVFSCWWVEILEGTEGESGQVSSWSWAHQENRKIQQENVLLQIQVLSHGEVVSLCKCLQKSAIYQCVLSGGTWFTFPLFGVIKEHGCYFLVSQNFDQNIKTKLSICTMFIISIWHHKLTQSPGISKLFILSFGPVVNGFIHCGSDKKYKGCCSTTEKRSISNSPRTAWCTEAADE